jgi:hypothetical protein
MAGKWMKGAVGRGLREAGATLREETGAEVCLYASLNWIIFDSMEDSFRSMQRPWRLSLA